MGIVTKNIQAIKTKKFGVGDAVNIIFGISEYKDARDQGDGAAKSIVKAGVSLAWGEIYYGGMNELVSNTLTSFLPTKLAGALTFGAMFGVPLAKAGFQLMNASSQNTTRSIGQSYASKGAAGSGYFNMTETGYTMRQRSLNAIRSNGLNTRSVLGNEARTYFRGSI